MSKEFTVMDVFNDMKLFFRKTTINEDGLLAFNITI